MFREKTFFEKILPKVMGWYCSETHSRWLVVQGLGDCTGGFKSFAFQKC